VFCEDQSRALDMLRAKLLKQRDNKDQRLTQILQVTLLTCLLVIFDERSIQEMFVHDVLWTNSCAPGHVACLTVFNITLR